MNWVLKIANLRLLVVLLCMASFSRIYAQSNENTGSLPYINSRHAYQVNVGLKNNDRTWEITNKLTGDQLREYDLESVDNASWATISPATSDGGAEIVSIFFDSDKFANGDWYLQCSEFQVINGSTTCVSDREFKITIYSNTFYLTLSADGSVKNSQHEVPHTLDEVDSDDNKFSTTINTSSSAYYAVTMNKADNFHPDEWSFTATFDHTVVPAASCTASVSEGSVTVSDGATVGDNIYEITVTKPAGGFTNSVTVSFSATFSEPVHADVASKLTVSNGWAMVNGSPVAATKDNVITYPVAPDTPGDREQTITILALPTPADITSDEAAWSAQSPLQNSTHSYKVDMGATANIPVAWQILNSDGTPLANAENADYEIVASAVSGDYATVSFLFKMMPGNYIIEYRETDATKATTAVRRYPITILAPFDVDIAAVDARCATVSDVVNNTFGTPTVTTVQYTVTLNSTAYAANWSFDFAATANPALGNDATADLRITNISTPTSGCSYNAGTGTFTVTNSAADPESGSLKSVVVEVTYSGFYQLEHEITATLTNITGSYSESDADATNSIVHTIYSLPQPGTLAGVD